MNKQRFAVIAQYIERVEKSPFMENYPRLMGYYDVDTPQEAFAEFVKEFAPDVQQAQVFYDDVIIIPVPKTGYKFRMSKVFGQLAKFPNPELLDK